MTRRSATLRLALTTSLIALVASFLAAFALWLRVTPGPADWTVRVPIGIGALRRPVEVSVHRLLHAATDPAWARWLDGRTIPSTMGALMFRWHDGSLVARCAPCVLRIDALGDAPINLTSAELTLRRLAEGRYAGRLQSGNVMVPFNLDVTRASLALRAELPPTPIAALYGVFGHDIPEARRARIEGAIAASMTLDLPRQRWSIAPSIEGFEVHGMGTQSLLNSQLPSGCPAPPRGRVSPWLERAVIAAEDQRFAEHAGYDLAELRHAIDHNQQQSRSARGASTINQQLAKLLYTGDERSLARKARELLYAVEMDRTLGKARLLRLYLGVAPWGEGLCGAEAAARHYFAKGAAALDPLEAAWLAVRLRMPDAPPAAVTPERVARVLGEMRGLTSTKRNEWVERATPTLFAEDRQPKHDYLAIPRTSSEHRRYLPIGFLPSATVAANDLQVVPGGRRTITSACCRARCTSHGRVRRPDVWRVAFAIRRSTPTTRFPDRTRPPRSASRSRGLRRPCWTAAQRFPARRLLTSTIRSRCRPRSSRHTPGSTPRSMLPTAARTSRAMPSGSHSCSSCTSALHRCCRLPAPP